MTVEEELYSLWINHPYKFIIPFEQFQKLQLSEIVNCNLLKLNLKI